MNQSNFMHKILGTVALASASLLAAPPETPVKVGFVYVGPVGDAGWTFQHDLGRKQLEKDFKGKVVTQFVENVPEGADSERVIREMAKSGCKVVFTTSFGYMNPTLAVAKTVSQRHVHARHRLQDRRRMSASTTAGSTRDAT